MEFKVLRIYFCFPCNQHEMFLSYKSHPDSFDVLDSGWIHHLQKSKIKKDLLNLFNSITVSFVYSQFSHGDRWHHQEGSSWSVHEHCHLLHECVSPCPRSHERGSCVCCWSASPSLTLLCRRMHSVCRCNRAMSCGFVILRPGNVRFFVS